MARKSIYPPSVTPGIPRLGGKPEGWVETAFGEVLQVVQRRTEVADDSEYQLVNAKRSRGGVVARERLLGRQVLTKTQFLVRTDDFLISKRQIIHGACGIVPASLDGALVSNEYATLRVRDGLLLDYLRYFTHTVYFQQTCLYASVGVDVEKMIFRLGDWMKYKFHLPPLPEQRKITAILGTWDEAIALTERRIAVGQQRMQGVMQRLLTGRVRFPGFEHLDWQDVRLRDVCSLVSGTGFPREYQGLLDRPILFAKVSDMNTPGNEKYIWQANNTVDGETIAQLQASVFEKGTTVMPKVGAALLTNKRRLLTCPTAIDNNVMALVPTRVEPEYLYYWSLTLKMEHYAQSGALPSVNQTTLGSIQLAIPSLNEQYRIVEVLAACDRELDLLARKRDALQRQKRGLMQQLLTGRVRVKV
jgi:type I restriction enzyme S subunit